MSIDSFFILMNKYWANNWENIPEKVSNTIKIKYLYYQNKIHMKYSEEVK